jgi:two-component system, cell cycle sensor histidine kinase and response regulator CckA
MTKASILVVEDESIVAKDVRSRLQRQGYEVTSIVATGEDAIDHAGKERPQLVLMDIMLKGTMDGIAAAEIIRQRYDIPVVYLTAYADDQTLQRAKITEAFGYLLKPFEERELQITIEMALFKFDTERRLRQHEQWLAATLSSMGEGVIATDRDHRITFVNPIAELLTGTPQADAVGKPLGEVFRTEEEDDASGHGRSGPRPRVLMAANGARIPIDENSSPLQAATGETGGLVIVFRDVTSRRIFERRLVESEANLRALFESSIQSLFLLNAEGRILSLNRLAHDFLKDVAGMDAQPQAVLQEYLPADFRAKHEGNLHRCLAGEQLRTEVEFQMLNGNARVFDIVYRPVYDSRGMVLHVSFSLFEITERIAAERALRTSEERIGGIIASTMDAIISLDGRQRIVVFNAAAEKMFQCRAVDALGELIDRFIPVRARNGHQNHINEFGATGVTSRQMGTLGKVVGLRTNGEEFPIEASISQLQVGPERLYTIILRDITERVRSEEALVRSQERYRRFFEDDITADYVATASGQILECNPAFVRIFGFASHAEAVGTNVFDLYPDPVPAKQEFLSLLTTQRRLIYYEKELQRRDGAPVYIVGNTIGSFNPDGTLHEFMGYLFDDTERKRLEEQLRQSQKMESIGTLASGIAHDFNNILNNVLGFATQLKKHLHDQTRVLKYSQNIEKSAARGAELSAQLLSFARVSKREYVPTNVGPIIDEVMSLCQETFPRNITLRATSDAPLRFVQGDRGALYQVLLNLCLNARDAVISRVGNGEGMLTIDARNSVVGQDISTQLLGANDQYCVELRVTDNGTGIPREIRERIFDPFFTTKERGRGTGLGLSVVYSIVRNHRGVMQVESEEGEGSTFRVFLPAIAQMPAVEAVIEPPPTVRGQNELVMIVDDEESMQELARELLEDHGYKVAIAGNGRDAIEIYARRHAEIALVILDLVMPGLDGGQTFMELKKINPGLKAFFCTGFMPDRVIAALLEREHLRAIQKPFNPLSFVQVVREVLDDNRGGS